MPSMKLLATLLCTILLAAAPAPPGANLSLASSFIASGGGPGSFSSVRAFNALVGADAVIANQRQLVAAYGQDNANQFIHVFDYAIADAWQLAGKHNVSIPPAAQSGGQGLATQLVQAGIGNGTTFDNDVFFTGLFGSKIAGQVALDVNAKFGASSWTTFGEMSDQFFRTIGQAVGMKV
jgi:hypothetical protein